MKRVLILGCSEITKRLLVELCNDLAFVSDISLVSRNKEDCDELKNLAAEHGVRVTTAGIDLSNIEGAMMMIKILAPDVVVNLLPPELSLDAMNLALKAKADYIDSSLFGVPEIPSATSLLAKQFERFSEFQNNCNTAVCGAGLVPGAVTTIIRRAADESFRNIDYTLYSEDVKAPAESPKKGSEKKVFYIEAGKVVEAEANSIEAESDSGSAVYLSSSSILSDI